MSSVDEPWREAWGKYRVACERGDRQEMAAAWDRYMDLRTRWELARVEHLPRP